MSKSNPAIPAKPTIFFPSPPDQTDWKTRFERVIDNGKGIYLTFPFTYIREKQPLFALYESLPDVLRDHPGLLDTFFEDADRACELAERDIEQERLKNLPGDPAQVISFTQPAIEKGGRHGK